jgi:hypothetical protein
MHAVSKQGKEETLAIFFFKISSSVLAVKALSAKLAPESKVD